jgi:RNA polymerase sigma-70 factor (family 1)
MEEKYVDKESRPIRELSAAEAEEFGQVFKKYYPRLCHFSFRVTGCKALSEDICQEAFISYWNHRGNIADAEDAVKSYLYTAVRNASISKLRHDKVVKRYLKSQDTPGAGEITIDHAMIQSEVAAEIHSALEKLPQGCRQVVRMAYLEGMKNKEIASKLGVSVNTVKTQRQRAIHLLRSSLKPGALSLLLTGLW